MYIQPRCCACVGNLCVGETGKAGCVLDLTLQWHFPCFCFSADSHTILIPPLVESGGCKLRNIPTTQSHSIPHLTSPQSSNGQQHRHSHPLLISFISKVLRLLPQPSKPLQPLPHFWRRSVTNAISPIILVRGRLMPRVLGLRGPSPGPRICVSDLRIASEHPACHGAPR